MNELQEQDIDNCVEIIENEDLDAASTSYNFLESGQWRKCAMKEIPGPNVSKNF